MYLFICPIYRQVFIPLNTYINRLILTMVSFTTEIGKDNRITVSACVVKALKVKRGDIVEVNVKKVK